MSLRATIGSRDLSKEISTKKRARAHTCTEPFTRAREVAAGRSSLVSSFRVVGRGSRAVVAKRPRVFYSACAVPEEASGKRTGACGSASPELHASAAVTSAEGRDGTAAPGSSNHTTGATGGHGSLSWLEQCPVTPPACERSINRPSEEHEWPRRPRGRRRAVSRLQRAYARRRRNAVHRDPALCVSRKCTR